MKFQSSLFAIAATVCALPSSAQVEAPYEAQLVWPAIATDDILFPTGSGDPVQGIYKSIEAGDLTDDGEADALLVAGNDVHAVFRLSQAAHSERIVSGATSAAIYPLGAGAPIVITSTANGLESFRYAAGTGFAPIPFSAGAGLTQTERLAVAQLDGVNRPELVSVSPLTTGLVQAWGADGLQFLPILSLPHSVPVVDIAVLDTDSDGTDEIAVLTDSFVRIYAADGSVLGHWAAPSSAGHMAVIDSTATQPGDRLAWVRPNATDTLDELQVLEVSTPAPSSLAMEFAVTAGTPPVAVDVIGIATGDSDADGDQDVVLLTSNFEASVVAENVGGPTPTYQTGEDDYRLISFDDSPFQPYASSMPTPLLLDLDRDGDGELIVPWAAGDRLIFSDLTPGFDSNNDTVMALDDSTGSPFFDVRYAYDDSLSEPFLGPLVLFLEVDSALIGGSSPFDHLQAQVWRQPDGSSLVEADGTLNAMVPVTDPTTLSPPVTPGEEGRVAIEIQLEPNPGAAWAMGRHYYVSLRLVDYDPVHGSIGQRTIWINSGMTLDDGNPTYQDQLETDPYTLSELDVFSIDPEDTYTHNPPSSQATTGNGTTGGQGEVGASMVIDWDDLPVGVPLGLSVELGRIGNFAGAPRPPALEVEPLETSPLYFWEF